MSFLWNIFDQNKRRHSKQNEWKTNYFIVLLFHRNSLRNLNAEIVQTSIQTVFNFSVLTIISKIHYTNFLYTIRLSLCRASSLVNSTTAYELWYYITAQTKSSPVWRLERRVTAADGILMITIENAKHYFFREFHRLQSTLQATVVGWQWKLHVLIKFSSKIWEIWQNKTI